MPDAHLAVIGGIGCHTDFHVAAALDPLGRVLGTRSFRATVAGCDSTYRWLASFGPITAVGMESTGSCAAAMARSLAEQGSVRRSLVKRRVREAGFVLVRRATFGGLIHLGRSRRRQRLERAWDLWTQERGGWRRRVGPRVAGRADPGPGAGTRGLRPARGRDRSGARTSQIPCGCSHFDSSPRRRPDHPSCPPRYATSSAPAARSKPGR